MPAILKSLLNITLFISFSALIIIIVHRSTTEVTKQERRIESQKEDKFQKIWTAKGDITYTEAEETIFRPMGYEMVEEAVVPALKFINRPQCSRVFEDWLIDSASQNESATPPRDIPPEYLNQYTMNGYSKLVMDYCDNRSGTHTSNWTKEVVDELATKKVTDVMNYGGEGLAAYYAMKAYGVKDQSGIIIGSLSPWVEGFAIRLGAAKIKTIEYMKITTPKEYPWMSYAHPVDIAKDYKNHLGAYDFVVSFSSIEHSGLGRFGDALDPIGDIKESLKVYCMLKEGGIFFLGIPTGRDAIYWNLHRGYGRLRLAIMAAGFDIIDMFRNNERLPITPEFFLDLDGAQPVLVLRKRYSYSISKIS